MLYNISWLQGTRVQDCSSRGVRDGKEQSRLSFHGERSRHGRTVQLVVLGGDTGGPRGCSRVVLLGSYWYLELLGACVASDLHLVVILAVVSDVTFRFRVCMDVSAYMASGCSFSCTLGLAIGGGVK